MGKKLRHLSADDNGVAMLTVVGVLVLMTIAALAAYWLSQQAILETSRTSATMQAFQAANSGVDVALNRLQSHGYTAADYPVSGTLPNGSSYIASVTVGANSNFQCVSTGTGPDGIQQVVTVGFFYFSLWNMEIANNEGVSQPSGGALVGNTSIYGPIYCRGSVLLSGSSNIDMGPLFVNGGGITLSGSGSIGAAGAIDVYVSGSHPNAGSKGWNVSSVSNSVPNITLPKVDQAFITAAYTQARSESIDNKQGYASTGSANSEAISGNPTTYSTMSPPNSGTYTRQSAPGASGYYKVIGLTAPIVGSGTQGLAIDGSRSWGSWYGDGHTTTVGQHDDFAFDRTTGTLYVEGTVFIDGPLTITTPVRYVGNGTIVVNGDITSTTTFVPNTANNQMDAGHVVGLVTPGNMSVSLTGGGNAKGYGQPPDFAGAFFVGGGFSIDGHPLVRGSILASTIEFHNGASGHLETEPLLPTFLPQGLPSAGQSILYKGAWTRR